MKLIPNLFTLLNLVFGCLAIISILQNGIVLHYDDEGTQLVAVSENLRLASVFIAAAAVIDFLDGFVARLLNASSELGRQLDSLADVVSFGVAPSMILYQLLRMSWVADEDGINIHMTWLLPSLLVAVAAAYRLGKFNIDEKQKFGFRGMPTPAVGLLVASFPMIYWGNSFTGIQLLLINKWVLYSMIIFLSWIMVSNLPMLAMKFKNFSFKSNLPRYLLFIIGIISIVLLGWLSVPVIFLAYIILSLVFKNYT